jgi:hypothetical protein
MAADARFADHAAQSAAWIGRRADNAYREWAQLDRITVETELRCLVERVDRGDIDLGFTGLERAIAVEE